MAKINDPRSKMLSSDEELIEVIEVVEEVEDYSDLDNKEDEDTYVFDYDAEL
jgi:hypothetical protein